MTVFNVTSRLCLALALTAAIGQAGTALAQNARTIIVGSGKAAVEVDLGVLNRLGPAPNLPRLLSPRPAMTAATAQPPGGVATPSLRDALRLPPAAGRSSTALRMPVPQPPTRERLVVRVPAQAAPRPPVAQTPIRKPVAKTPVIKAPMAAPKKPAPVTPAAIKTAAKKPAPKKPVMAKSVVAKPVPPKPPVTSAPKPAAKVAAVAPRVRVEAQTPNAPAAGARDWRIVFAADSADLTDEGRRAIGDVAALLAADTGKKISIRAHADSRKGGAGAARRLSFSRAIAIRAALIDKGVLSTRMHLWARGDRDKVTPRDLVEIRLIDQ